MAYKDVLICILLCMAVMCRPSYKACAVTHTALRVHTHKIYSRSEALMFMKQNWSKLDELVGKCAAQGAQIVVLPEDCLYGLGLNHTTIQPFTERLPAIHTTFQSHCKDGELYILCKYMESAIRHGVVLVGTLASQDLDVEETYYNTQVAISEVGVLLQYYRKIHLYGEKEYAVPPHINEDIVHFTTSFGVTFGMSICYDGLFSTPSIPLLLSGVRDFVFSSYWFNYFPYIDAISFQRAWSEMLGVNVIAANTGSNWLTSGSGIYHKGEIIDSHMNVGITPYNGVLSVDVPIIPTTIVNITIPPLTTIPFSINIALEGNQRVFNPMLVEYPLQVQYQDVNCTLTLSQVTPLFNHTPSWLGLIAGKGRYIGIPRTAFCGIVQCYNETCHYLRSVTKGQYKVGKVAMQVETKTAYRIYPFLLSDMKSEGTSIDHSLRVEEKDGIFRYHVDVDLDDKPLVGVNVVGRPLDQEYKQIQH